MDGENRPDVGALLAAMMGAFPGYYENLINANPVQCFETKTTFDAISRPSAIILDVGLFFPSYPKKKKSLTYFQNVYFQFFLYPILRQIRSATRESIPVLAWATVYAPFTLRFLGPKKFGGYGDVANQARALAEKNGRNVDDVLDEVGPPFYSCSYNTRGYFLTVDVIPSLVVPPERRKTAKNAWVSSNVRV